MRLLPIWADPAMRLPGDPPVIKDRDRRHDLYDAITDNSNTHFAMIGLWAARKHDIPVDRTFTLVNRRFRTSQGAGGTWAYDFSRTGADGSSAMTCIALLGVAIGHVVAPEPDAKPETDPVIINAFTALSKTIGAPVGDINNRPKIKDVGGLYFLWSNGAASLVLYDLQEAFGQEGLVCSPLLLWGAEIIICNQISRRELGRRRLPRRRRRQNPRQGREHEPRAPVPEASEPHPGCLSKKLLVNPTALTAKVNDKISPKVEPPPPTPKVVEPIAIAPMPRTVEPKTTPAVSAPAPAPQQEAAAPALTAKKTPWLFIILGMVLAAGIGGGLAFFFVAKRRKKDEDEEDEGEKKKKKGKKKAKAEADKPAKPEGGKKVKAKAVAEEDE